MPVKTKRDEEKWQKAKEAGHDAYIMGTGACGQTLPLGEFWKNASKPDGLQTQCKRFHFAAMDFDHVRGVKEPEALKAELAKCEIVCANCRKTGRKSCRVA